MEAPQQDIKALAAEEERRTAELIAQARAMQEPGGEVPASAPVEEEPLISILSKGQDYLHEKMREKMARDAAVEASRAPPERTERQQALLTEEQEAGRRAAARHQAELDARPPRPRDPADGTTTPVHRPGSAVPGPYDGAPGSFVAGKGAYSPDV